MKRKIISTDPDVMGGTPCFAGTRVPVQTLLDYLEAGDSIDDFLGGFPTVKRAQIVEFLETAAERLAAVAAGSDFNFHERIVGTGGRSLAGVPQLKSESCEGGKGPPRNK